jgi:large subunit ribosomal protein L10
MNPRKIQTVSDLAAKIVKAKSLVLADYRGLTHQQSEELRRAVKKAAGEFTVAKNTLLKIAARQVKHEKLAQNNLQGPLAVLFAYEDEFAPLRELAKFIKTFQLPVFKLSFFGETEYDAARTAEIAKLPDVQTLRAQFVYSLNGNLQKLVYILSQIKKDGDK